MIELENVCKRYQMGGEVVTALDHVTLAIADREYVAIIGPSGSGKSTLMNIIGCLDNADEGAYRLDGQDITRYTPRQLAAIRNRKVGFIFQQFNLLQKLTAYENVELPLIYQGLGSAERRARVSEALARVGLDDRMRHRPNQLSGGQQQRVAIARALVTQPSLILADEPTGNLDSKTSVEIMAMLDALHQAGNSIVVITHDQGVAERAPRRVRIHDGCLTEEVGA
ncbi:MAG: ABC transporter ATP-binding protein [Oscillospiraceae bacterium]|jgi:putative ABC transport system ATP-binding protein|nr:ABC transporter ATP-binding protein [Oscillospiraceae bacterium]